MTPDPNYSGPILDAFLHSPWFGDKAKSEERGDKVPWVDDPRLRRVMNTFHHSDEHGRATLMGTKQLLSDMDRAGVERAILPAKVYYAASEAAVDSLHGELAAMANASGGRIKVVGTLVPPELGPGSYWDVMQHVRMLEATHARWGFVGVHVTPAPWGMPPNDKWFYPLYAKCVELDLALFTYVGMPGPLWPMSHNDPSHLDEIALAFPDLTIVAHHIGDPWVDMAVRLAARHEHVYICTSAWSPKRYPTALLEFMRDRWHGTPGSSKVIFASDHPLLDMHKTSADARALDLSEAQLRAVLFENANRMFWPETEEASA